MGLFAKPYMQFEMSQNKKTFFIAEILHKILHLKRAKIFRNRMAMTGIIFASVLHGCYDTAMTLNPTFTIGDSIFQLHVFLLPIMLVGGILFLTHLLQKKVNIQEFGIAEIEYTYKRIGTDNIKYFENKLQKAPRLSRFHKTA
jgi:hypothetical protein